MRFKHSKRNNQKSGFTLVEVLIALAILAICSAIAARQVSISVLQQQITVQNTLATWVMQNELAQVRLTPNIAIAGIRQSETEFANATWEITTVIEPTVDENIYTIQVNARNINTPDKQSSLHSFITKPSS